MNRINERDVHPFTPRVIVGMTLAFDHFYLKRSIKISPLGPTV